jgi:hypothetical protein
MFYLISFLVPLGHFEVPAGHTLKKRKQQWVPKIVKPHESIKKTGTVKPHES